MVLDISKIIKKKLNYSYLYVLNSDYLEFMLNTVLLSNRSR